MSLRRDIDKQIKEHNKAVMELQRRQRLHNLNYSMQLPHIDKSKFKVMFEEEKWN